MGKSFFMVQSGFRSWDSIEDLKTKAFCVGHPLFNRIPDNVGPVQGSMKVGNYRWKSSIS